MLDPLVARLDSDATVVRFDVPGVGGSPTAPLRYGFPYLAALLGRLLGSSVSPVRWTCWAVRGAARWPSSAFQNPRRCRKLILVSTGTGAVMVPGKPSVLVKMLIGRRFVDRNDVGSMAGDLYGGTVRTDVAYVRGLFDRQAAAGARVGYRHQLLAAAAWTGICALPLIRQDTLIVAGTDDPIVPVVNVKVMAALMLRATVHVPPGGRADLVANAAALAAVIEEFRNLDRGQRYPASAARDAASWV